MAELLYADENGNIWRWTENGYELVDTIHDPRPSHELWHPGRGETKRGEREPLGKLKPLPDRWLGDMLWGG